MKMLITLGLHGIFWSNFAYLCILNIGMQNADEASPKIILASRALLIKMLITLEMRGLFCSNLYTIYFNIVQHCPTAGMRNGDEASSSINLAGQAFSENAQNSWTAWCILIKFCMLLYYYLDWELPGILS